MVTAAVLFFRFPTINTLHFCILFVFRTIPLQEAL